MAKISLTDRQRYALVAHLNRVSCTSRAEQRAIDRIFSAPQGDESNGLDLDPIALQCDAATSLPRLTDFDNETVREYSLTSDTRDHLITFLEPTPQAPMAGGMARQLSAISAALIRSRDGE